MQLGKKTINTESPLLTQSKARIFFRKMIEQLSFAILYFSKLLFYQDFPKSLNRYRIITQRDLSWHTCIFFQHSPGDFPTNSMNWPRSFAKYFPFAIFVSYYLEQKNRSDAKSFRKIPNYLPTHSQKQIDNNVASLFFIIWKSSCF